MKLAESMILIVDDDEEIIIQARKILENLGTQVLSAHDVHTALEIVNESKPHLIITDIEMSPLNGFDLLKKLKDEKNLNTIPVVVFSSLNDKESVYKAISLGARDYIVKPLRTGNFVKKIRRALKDHDFLRFDVDKAEPLMVTALVAGTIQSVSDIGLRIESSTCIAASKSITLKESRPEVEYLDQLTFAVPNKGFRAVKGLYVHEMIAVPAGSEFAIVKKRLLE